VYLLDIFPTVCSLVGAQTPASVEGMSLAPFFKDQSARGREFLYLAYADTIRGVTDGSRKLIEYACGATQLFDLAADPLEMNNLAEHINSSADLAALRKTLLKLAAEWDDERHSTGKAFWARRGDLKR
jgi:arylsulfatase A-like enzyme